jgi:hypothetical protein
MPHDVLTYRMMFSNYHLMVFCIAQAGLREVTSDISNLVNLRLLTLVNNWGVRLIPDSISCLQKLEHVRIENSLYGNVADGLSTLSNLASLHITWDYLQPQFPADLRVLNITNNNSNNNNNNNNKKMLIKMMILTMITIMVRMIMVIVVTIKSTRIQSRD